MAKKVVGAEAPATPEVVRKTWEYYMIASNYISPERLNLLGSEGWELVTVTSWYYFKREII
jgi:hypothetical protein